MPSRCTFLFLALKNPRCHSHSDRLCSGVAQSAQCPWECRSLVAQCDGKVFGESASRLLIRKKKQRSIREKAANEVSEAEVRAVLEAIRNYHGYPKLRELGALVPTLRPFKLNVVVRYLERSGTILIDDGLIVWNRQAKSESSSLADVAELSPEFRELLKGK